MLHDTIKALYPLVLLAWPPSFSLEERHLRFWERVCTRKTTTSRVLRDQCRRLDQPCRRDELAEALLAEQSPDEQKPDRLQPGRRRRPGFQVDADAAAAKPDAAEAAAALVLDRGEGAGADDLEFGLRALPNVTTGEWCCFYCKVEGTRD